MVVDGCGSGGIGLVGPKLHVHLSGLGFDVEKWIGRAGIGDRHEEVLVAERFEAVGELEFRYE